VSRVAATFDRMPVFRVTNHVGSLQGVDACAPPGARVVAVAGIARPERFFTTLREQGFEIVRELRFPDHHWFSSDDLDRIGTIAKEASADLVVTTEKDAVRVAPQPGWAVLPMPAVIEPAEQFSAWLRERL
jgi:tetraacyldisaccharide 4'-kinase